MQVFKAEAFDVGMMSLGSIMIASPGGEPGTVMELCIVSVSVHSPGISKLVITNSAADPFPGVFPGFGVDNLQFTPVPEPTSLALLGMTAAGFCGVRIRRRRKGDTANTTQAA